MTFKYVGYEVSQWYVSKTLEQEFNNSVQFEFDVESYLKKGFDFDKFKDKNIVIVAIQIETTFKGFFEYNAQYQYDVDCSTYLDEDKQVALMINDALVRYQYECEKRNPGFDLWKLLAPRVDKSFPSVCQDIIQRLRQKS